MIYSDWVAVVKDGNAWVPIRMLKSLTMGFSVPWEALDRHQDKKEARKQAAAWAREKGWRFVDVH